MQSAYQAAFGLYPLLFYKEAALFLRLSFWLHQGRIPRHTCRFYCCLAAHQRTRKKDSAEPSFAMEPRLRGSVDSTSSTRGYPLRRGKHSHFLPVKTGKKISLSVAEKTAAMTERRQFFSAAAKRIFLPRVTVSRGTVSLDRQKGLCSGMDTSSRASSVHTTLKF